MGMAECRYWHRSLNPKKLIDIGFSHLQPRMTIGRTIKLYKLPDQHVAQGFRKMEKKDIPVVHKLLTEYLPKFRLHPEFSLEEVEHWICPRDDVVFALVRETGEGKNKKVTDFCSFYRLPSTILGHPEHKLLKCAYSFWNVATSCTLQELMQESLIYARDVQMDAFNALDVMENESFLKELKFGVGDGYLQYYLYNWRCTKLDPPEVGLVLL